MELWKSLVTVVAALIVLVGDKKVSAEITDACISCLAKVELGKPNKCNDDQGSPSCGVYQMKRPYWIDCYMPMNSLEECAFDEECAKSCIKAYTARYAFMCKAQLDKAVLSCEDYGRMHNGGGPSGCKGEWTLQYVELMRSKCTTEELNSLRIPTTLTQQSTGAVTPASSTYQPSTSTTNAVTMAGQRSAGLRRLLRRIRNRS